MNYPALTKCFLDAVDRHANPRAQMHRGGACWESISAVEMLRRVAGISRALAELGIKLGDRVSIFAPNCPEWHVADFAIQALGGVSVPIYFNESQDRICYILNDSGARIVITSGETQARQIAECRERLSSVEQIISARIPEGLRDDLLRYETLIATARDDDVASYRRRAADISGSDLATIIYTSGTTGEPKGVMLSHANLSSNTLDSCVDYEMQPTDLGLSLLPLAHVYERITDYSYIFRGVPVAYVEQIESAAQAIREVRPTILAGVPRFFEKIYANIIEKGQNETGMKRRAFEWALRVAQDSVPWRAYGRKTGAAMKCQWALADKLVFSKIRAGLGGKIRLFISGGAPLAPELAEFFWAVGLPVYQGYGLTETSPVVSANTPGHNKVGTVGRAIPNVQLSFSEDGEILVKGPCVMQGYYRKPEETRETFTPDGWFCTGDIGRLDEDGYLVITDRKKELLKTAAGKFVAPAPIENLLKTSLFVANAIVVGDRRKFISVLIVPDFSAIEREARKSGMEISNPARMIADPWVRDLLAREIERLTARLAQYEKPKRFALLEKDFSIADGELTYTMKMKRRVIEQHYQDVIERLYADVEDPRPQTRA